MPARKTYDDLINKTFNMLTVTGLAGRRKNGEQLFYCECSCGMKNHLASKELLVKNKIISCGCIKRDTEDMIGKVFTNLTVIKKLGEKGYKNGSLFLCQCTCGNTTKALKSKLVHGSTKSCGCLLKEQQTKYSNLVGNKYHKLTVIKKLGIISKRRDIFWECKCDCGNIVKVTTGNLIHGSVQGCGCVARERILQYRISKGHNPLIPMKSQRELLRGKVKKLQLGKKAFKRDKYTCQLCGEVGGKLNAHHIVTIGENDTKALDINNIITLCKKCHLEKAHNSNYRNVNKQIQEELIKKAALFTEPLLIE